VIGNLLKGNVSIGKILNSLTYSNVEVRDITFLVELLGLDNFNVPTLKKKQKNVSLTNDEIYLFGIHCDINEDLLNKFISFELSVDGNDVAKKLGLKGSELGEAIDKLEVYNFMFKS
jgi:hypothetical protein